jgi:hypothetical protein
MQAEAALTVRDVVDLLFAARERIDFYWNFYVVVVIAVIGWLVSQKRMLTFPMKVLVSVGYLIAAALNVVGLYGAYTFAEALRLDLLRMVGTAPLTDTRMVLERHSYASQRLVAFATHLVVGATIMFVIWSGRFSRAAETTNAPSLDE